MNKQKNVKMLRKKAENGITLIALIITIIVLLILAGVTIAMIVGDNGILTRAKEAKTETEESGIKEEIQIAHAGSFDENTGGYSVEKFKEEMEAKDYTAEGESWPVTVSKNGKTYTISEEGKVYEGENPATSEEGISQSESYVGYYADVDGNGTVDGVIYADLAFSKNGQWYDSDGTYSYTAETDLKDYYVSQASYKANDGFGDKPVLSAVLGTIGNDRFYVMALSDFDSSTHYWYGAAGAYDMIGEYEWWTDTGFGTGKINTIDMVQGWNNSWYGEQNEDDMWGVIQGSSTYPIVTSYIDSGKWFVPSNAEWSAFATAFSITTSNYSSTYGLDAEYWSSSQGYEKNSHAFSSDFRYGYIDWTFVSNSYTVRLSATF